MKPSEGELNHRFILFGLKIQKPGLHKPLTPKKSAYEIYLITQFCYFSKTECRVTAVLYSEFF